MFSFRRLLSAFTPNDDRQTRGDEHAEIEISDDSNEENGVGMNSGSADNDKHSGSENKKRKRREDEDLIAMSPPGKMAKTNSPNRKISSVSESNTTQNNKKSAEKKKVEHDQHDLPNLTTTSSVVQKYRAKSSPPPPNLLPKEPMPEHVRPKLNGSAHPLRSKEISHEEFNNGETRNGAEPEEEVIIDSHSAVETKVAKTQPLSGLFGRTLTTPAKQQNSSHMEETSNTAIEERKPASESEKKKVKPIPKTVERKIEETHAVEKKKEGEAITKDAQELAEDAKSIEEISPPAQQKQKFALDTPVYISDEVDVNDIFEKKPKKKKLRRLKRNSLDGEDLPEDATSKGTKRNNKKISPIQQAISRIKEGKKKEVVIENYEEILDDDEVPVEPKTVKQKVAAKQNGSTPKQPSKPQEPLKTMYKSRQSTNINNTNVNNASGEKEEEYIDDRLLYDAEENVPVKSYSAFIAQLSSSKSFVLDGVEYKQGDYVILNGGEEENWFCRIEDIFTEDNDRKLTVRWFYEPSKNFKWEDEDLDEFEPNELVASNHFDENYEDTILEKCAIYHLEEYKSVMHKREQAAKHGEDSAPKMKEFFYKYFYDIETGEVVDLAKKKTKAVRNKRQRVKFHETHKLKGSLAERFLVVPQSFLDTRQGPWRQRNQMWLSLGINRSRGIEMKKDSYTIHASHMRDPQFYEKKSKKEAELGRKLTTKEYTDNYWDKVMTYAEVSVFDPTLAEISFRWFCPPSGRVLDPFAGSIRGIVASCLGLEYTGIELRKDQITQNKFQLERIRTKIPATWIEGDSRNITDLVARHYDLDPKAIKEEDKFDFIFSCPPFYDLEIYSDDPYDLSTLPTYEEFFNDYSKIIQQTAALLKDNRFAVFVVCDFRERQGIGQSIPFVSDTIKAFENTGMQYYNELILVNHLGSKRFMVQKMYNCSKKIARNHQNVLVFVKGDPKSVYTLQDSEYNIDELIKNNIEQILPVRPEVDVDADEQQK
jgi:hypothetical protein